MYMNFYKKIYAGNENHSDIRSLLIDWKSLPPSLNGWGGINGLRLDRIRYLMSSVGAVVMNPDTEGFSRFLRSGTLGSIAQRIENYLDENESVKEYETPEGLIHRSDMRELVRVLTKLSRQDYFAEIEY